MMKRLVVCSALLGLAACSSAPTTPVDPVQERIADGVDRIAAAYEQLALISSATGNKEHAAQDYNYDEGDLPVEWLQEITLLESYHGDLVSFVQMVSAIAGLKEPRVDTRARTRPIIVSINKGRRKLISYLADAGFQAGEAAIVQPDVKLNQVLVSIK